MPVGNRGEKFVMVRGKNIDLDALLTGRITKERVSQMADGMARRVFFIDTHKDQPKHDPDEVHAPALLLLRHFLQYSHSRRQALFSHALLQ